MRNSFLLAASLLAGVALAAAACSNVDAFGDSFEGSGAPTAADGRGDAGTVESDEAATGPGTLGVSRLCSASQLCLPDDDGTFLPRLGFEPCATPVVDGGVEPPRHDKACRIVGGVSQCNPGDAGADRQGVDGVSCSSGSDCAPGFDCVVGDTSRGAVCRRYCCAGSSACNEHTSANGGRTFCDVQSLEETGALVPVCLPIKQCKLLKAGECSASETCAVVSDKGETGCVTRGLQAAGASCEEAHCNVGLTCLGSPGDRRCYALCSMSDDSACEGPKKCTTSSLFPDTNTGVCR